MEYVFVYGTLRKGCSNHHLLKDARDIGPARTSEDYALYVHDYPYTVKSEAVGPIRGEVYLVDGRGLDRLDRLENHPHWYVREKKPVQLDEGREVQAWIYFFPEPRGHLVKSGDFVYMS
ncbi:AIG2 family protein [Desulfonatronospira thiodismutans ASO3-1]|uniref:Gamma-glutamylcyclotransferase family protein n=1 Tax=Desulfonatronospira thiodismutans ASO3-1 TaxID=555779 RepID=D6SPC4_9BACT|nr:MULTISPECIES: gamma-glutamylcyclotransferase family protein [Desulfonatronospira]EFI34600.1 AIG2 family protein [Desulfonatronospira thiodismutans ASO3-1]RQD76402.1 MAG: gamma-glutamylcyclotransferase [Desulfonatronospira sp. MSAO_Bac3]